MTGPRVRHPLNAGMDAETDLRALTDRVAGYFPRQSRDHIDDVVRGEYLALADRPIRLYISNLVEHSTGDRLRRESRPITRVA